mmetsp:Transcript_111/g.267  ORF Transcript_111/g.267 Transcript_111/m.267 type:complete len:204 (-) Transcript_111:2677-3288(-)
MTIGTDGAGYQDDHFAVNENEEKELVDDDAIEAKYEKLRDDQTNTGVIAALLGGFALTNSWEMEIGDESSNIEVVAYTLAILSVHACTCSALVSAFLYRQLTQQETRQKGLAWMGRHTGLEHIPWYKFLLGTLLYVCSVALVAWTSLDGSLSCRVVTLMGGSMSCSAVVYTLWIIYSDVDPEDAEPTAQETHTKHHNTKGRRI